MGSGNETVHLADEFVLFEETGLLISVGPNQTTDSDYDCEFSSYDF